MQTPLPVRKRFTIAQRESIVASYRRSNLTQRDFATEAGISLSSLHAWLRKSTTVSVAPPSGFIELPRGLSPVPHSLSPASYKLQFSSGLSLEIPRGFAAEEVARLCGILQSL